jgi:hypothetical protein
MRVKCGQRLLTTTTRDTHQKITHVALLQAAAQSPYNGHIRKLQMLLVLTGWFMGTSLQMLFVLTVWFMGTSLQMLFVLTGASAVPAQGNAGTVAVSTVPLVCRFLRSFYH